MTKKRGRVRMETTRMTTGEFGHPRCLDNLVIGAVTRTCSGRKKRSPKRGKPKKKEVEPKKLKTIGG